MRSLLSVSLLGLAATGLSCALIGLYTHAMRASRKLEAPNARSMHKVPVPVGAGIGIIATVVLLWPWWDGAATGQTVALLVGMAGLAAVSWIDDRHGLPVAARLITQAAAVALCLAWLPAEARLLPILPALVERLLLLLAWLWFINLFNFMDGIDGLAGSETLAVALGYALVLAHAGIDAAPGRLAIVVAAAAAGYLYWNWHPAKVFMGDAGSIPLGFVLGGLMLDLALRGYWAAGLILPLYFVADATLTLLARARRGERPWQAHREHFYQRAVLGGATPPGVVWRVAGANAVLVALALASISYPLAALAAAAGIVAGLMHHLGQLAGRKPS
jgi:UDP-N-acetylmuramyl pentapeptide phosphotransferase/UDP-N-acetylglucosamine-1-phosphate transferase